MGRRLHYITENGCRALDFLGDFVMNILNIYFRVNPVARMRYKTVIIIERIRISRLKTYLYACFSSIGVITLYNTPNNLVVPDLARAFTIIIYH